MKRKELQRRYDKLVSEVEDAEMYDGRGKGVDVYECQVCGHCMYTRYKDKGVTPFTLRCSLCGKTAMHTRTIPESVASACGYPVLDWCRPTFKRMCRMDEDMICHVLEGGMILENN